MAGNFTGLLALTSGASSLNHGIDAVTKTTSTKTHSIDVSIIRVFVHNSIDASILQTLSKTYSIDSSIKKTLSKTHSIDNFISQRKTLTYQADVVVGVATFMRIASLVLKTQTKTYSVDFIRAGGNRHLHQIDSFLARSRNVVTYSLDTLLSGVLTDPIYDGTLATALAQTTIRSKMRLSRIISRNSALINIPEITMSDPGNEVSNSDLSLIDGYDRSSMKFAFADSDATTNDGYRIFPDFNKIEDDQFIQKQKVPWITSDLTNNAGTFPSPIEILLHYSDENEFNMVEVATDQFGKGQAGIITNAKIEYSDDGSSWTVIGSNLSGFDSVQSQKLQLFYYHDFPGTNTDVWTTDREAFFENSNTQLITVTHPYVRITIYSISVNASVAAANRPRLGQFYEAGAFLWDAGIQRMNVTSFSVQEDRDLTSQTLSPIGSSSANTFNLEGTLAGKDTPYYDEAINPLAPNHDQFQNATYLVELGIQVSPTEYVYLDYGTYLADEMSMSAPDGNITISGRDFSKVLQETKMPSMFYEDITLHEVITDIVERAGIENKQIDTTEYTKQALAPRIVKEYITDFDFVDIHKPNLIWTQEQTCWEFLQSVAYADLGAFYFDKTNTFVYKAKEDLLRSDTPVAELTEEDNINSLASTNEIMKNSFSINYRVPEMTDNPIGIWSAEDDSLLVTALSDSVSVADETIPVGSISLWNQQGYFQIDNEIIRYKTRTDDAFTDCERGFLGTVPAGHVMNTDSSKWDFGGGTWNVIGGQLVATNCGGSYKETLSANKIDSSYYNFSAIVTINESPYAAAMLIRARDSDRHYRFVFKSVAKADIPGISSGEIYELYSVDGGVPTLLKSVSYSRRKFARVTGLPMHVRVQVDDEHLTLFIQGNRVLQYQITDTDLQITMPQKVGFAAIGDGPTTFENCYVTTLPEDNEGETIVFTDLFGRAIHEIRKYDAEYTPINNQTPPCSGVEYLYTNIQQLSVIYFRPNPFSATIYLRNDSDAPAIVSGSLGIDDEIKEYFILNGYALERSEDKVVSDENDLLISRYGRQELQVQLEWVQSDEHAKLLLEYLKSVYSLPTLFLDTGIVPNPSLKLGDVVSLGSDTNEIWMPNSSRPTFYIVGMTTAYAEGGLTQSIRLRSVVST